jgi:D-alanyl-D-alanine carboxypeptidase
MNGVRCFSGYILPSDGKPENTIVFSIMTNNTVVPSSKMNFIMDRIITLLAEEN